MGGRSIRILQEDMATQRAKAAQAARNEALLATVVGECWRCCVEMALKSSGAAVKPGLCRFRAGPWRRLLHAREVSHGRKLFC
ncbi:hypothetical protein GOP47_0026726 [Adiantum capillus-veneris]|nr:hypothetical protein GOP47_0026726 [Adiantum capillus-veneris]